MPRKKIGAVKQASGASATRRATTLGVRMTPDRVREVKVEAAARGMSVAALFEEIWRTYLARRVA